VHTRVGFCAGEDGTAGASSDPAKPVESPTPSRPWAAARVITSVNRDDQRDGGAAVFAACIREIRARVPGCAVEVLIPDFKGDRAALDIVIARGPTS